MGFWDGFKRGFNSVVDPVKSIPIIGKSFNIIPKLHKGGRVPKTGNYRLKQGEVVLNKTQQTQLRKAKSAKTRNKIITSVQKKKPKKMKRRYK
jgi:hypothetical protein